MNARRQARGRGLAVPTAPPIGSHPRQGVPGINDAVLDVARHGSLAVLAALFLAQAVAREIGVLLGRRAGPGARTQAEGVGVVVTGMLGLLAFVLALTLSFANTRYQERRDGGLKEANAIGTAWLRAEAIDHPHAAAIARLLETYAPVRRAYVTAPFDRSAIAAIDSRSNALQGEIWGHVAALVREQPSPITAALMNAVNDVFDQSTAQRLAFTTGLPPLLFWLLIGMTLASTMALGYQLGLRGLRVRSLSLALIGMWAVVITSILDLGSARLGSVRASPAAYEWTIQGFEGGVRIPPLP